MEDYARLMAEVESLRAENTRLREQLATEPRPGESETHFIGLALSHSLSAIATLDLSGRLTFVNRSFLRAWGYEDEQQVLDRHATEFWEDAAKPAKVIEAIRSDGSWMGVLRAKRQNGEFFDVQAVAAMLTDTNDVPTGMLGSFIDITEQKRAEDALRTSEVELRMVVTNLPLVLAAVDRDGIFTLSEGKGLEAVGLQPGQVVGSSFWDLYAGNADKLDAARRVLAGETFETTVQVGDVVFESHYTPILNGRGEVDGAIAVALNVTERFHAQESLRRSHARFQQVVERAADAILGTDPHGLIVLANHRATEIFGFTRRELLGMSIDELLPERFREKHPHQREGFAATHRPRPMGSPGLDLWGRRKDASEFPIEVSLTTIETEDERLTLATLCDISERRRAEDALREQSQMLSEAQRVARVGSWHWLVATDTITWSEEYHRIVGHDSKLPTPGYQKHREMYTPESAARLDAAVQEAMANGTPYELDLDLVRPDGVLLAVIARGEAVRDVSGAVVSMRGTLQDITERKQIDATLEESERRLRLHVLETPVAVIEWDTEFCATSWNPAAERIFGYTAEEAVGQHASIIVPEADRPLVESTFAKLMRLSGGEDNTNENVTKDGQLITCQWVNTPLISKDGNVIGVASLAQDITELRRHREHLETLVHERTNEAIEARDQAHVANRAKSEFLSRMSHELRTPLNVVLGFAQVLQLDELRPEQDEAVTHILGAGRHLLDLIDEVLDISSIEAGRMSLSIEPLDGREIVGEVITLMEPLAHERGISVELATTNDDCTVMADRQRLKQVLLNLLSNAIKYNRENGLVTVRCSEGDLGQTRILVTDTGRGIAPEKIVHLFQPFERLGAEVTGVQGTGLGLALSNQLVAAMQGTIGMESVLDVGSTFWVQLPTPGGTPAAGSGPAAVAETALPMEAGTKVGASPYTILYIEDTLSNLNLVERLLSRWPGVTLIPAMKGRLGLELARQYHPDLVLLDLHLPDLPGEEVLAELKADPATRDIPVIVVSAGATAGQVERLKAAGAIEYLTKPLDVRQFLSVVSDVLGRVQPDTLPAHS